MEEVTEEEIAHVYHRESEQISEALESVSQLGKPNGTAGSNVTTNDELDLSELVRLRTAHETEQARKGVQGSAGIGDDTSEVTSGKPQVAGPSPSGSARQEIVRKFYQLLRDADAEGERVGTGLHRSHIWSGNNGNALNAVKAAESRTSAVCT